MRSVQANIAAAAALLMVTVSAKEYYIDPESVLLSDRRGWCTSQKAACPLLCMQNKGDGTSVIANDCEPETLWYECICSNNKSPNMEEYSQTIPYFMCVAFGSQCIDNCPRADTLCQSNCRADNPCGAQEPKRYNLTTTTSSTASPTGGESKGTDGVVYNGFDAEPTSDGGSSSESASPNKGQMALDLGRSYGLAVVFTGLFAGFAMVM